MPFLEDGPVLIPLFLYNYISFMKKISMYETNIKQLLVYLKLETKFLNNR